MCALSAEVFEENSDYFRTVVKGKGDEALV